MARTMKYLKTRTRLKLGDTSRNELKTTCSTMAATFIHEIGLRLNKGHVSSWAVAHHLFVGEPAVYSGWAVMVIGDKHM